MMEQRIETTNLLRNEEVLKDTTMAASAIIGITGEYENFLAHFLSEALYIRSNGLIRHKFSYGHLPENVPKLFPNIKVGKNERIIQIVFDLTVDVSFEDFKTFMDNVLEEELVSFVVGSVYEYYATMFDYLIPKELEYKSSDKGDTLIEVYDVPLTKQLTDIAGIIFAEKDLEGFYSAIELLGKWVFTNKIKKSKLKLLEKVFRQLGIKYKTVEV